MNQENLNILITASECRGLAKVGGLADVVMDLSYALQEEQIKVSIIIPYYDAINCDAKFLFETEIEFGVSKHRIQVFHYILNTVNIFLIKSADYFSYEYGSIYIDSGKFQRGPFEDDAKRFAFFSKSVLELLDNFEYFKDINILHCNDWHTGVILTLLKYDSKYSKLAKKLKTVFTIHNLDYQGVRPFEMKENGNLPCFKSWFPQLYENLKADNKLTYIKDLNDQSCFNPMRAGIRCSNIANTVSPTYSKEITKKDNLSENFMGGRGLESDLKKLYDNHKLKGILNGLDYKGNNPKELNPPFDSTIGNWMISKECHKIQFLKNFSSNVQEIYQKIGDKFLNKETIFEKLKTYKYEEMKSKILIVAVTRVVNQKMGILAEKLGKDSTLIEEMLKKNIFLIVFGSGELSPQMEKINSFKNGFFINAFNPEFAKNLYIVGDLFLMPSDFEPCGISQMIAMRYGCLPLAHNIGGLHDTISNMDTGFLYSGSDRNNAKKALLATFEKAISCFYNKKDMWNIMQEHSMTKRFLWYNSAKEYIKMYKEIY